MKGKIDPAELEQARRILRAAWKAYPGAYKEREWELWVVRMLRTPPAERVEMKVLALLAKRVTRRVCRKKSDERKASAQRVLSTLLRMGEER